MTRPSPPPPLLRVPDVARWLGVDATNVRAMARRGELPHLRVGTGYRFEREQIETPANDDGAAEWGARHLGAGMALGLLLGMGAAA